MSIRTATVSQNQDPVLKWSYEEGGIPHLFVARGLSFTPFITRVLIVAHMGVCLLLRVPILRVGFEGNQRKTVAPF